MSRNRYIFLATGPMGERGMKRSRGMVPDSGSALSLLTGQ